MFISPFGSINNFQYIFTCILIALWRYMNYLAINGYLTDLEELCYELYYGADVNKCTKNAILIKPTWGVWAKWNEWSSCDKTCGGGIRSRSRLCQSIHANAKCEGVRKSVEKCNHHPCRKQKFSTVHDSKMSLPKCPTFFGFFFYFPKCLTFLWNIFLTRKDASILDLVNLL